MRPPQREASCPGKRKLKHVISSCSFRTVGRNDPRPAVRGTLIIWEPSVNKFSKIVSRFSSSAAAKPSTRGKEPADSGDPVTSQPAASSERISGESQLPPHLTRKSKKEVRRDKKLQRRQPIRPDVFPGYKWTPPRPLTRVDAGTQTESEDERRTQEVPSEGRSGIAPPLPVDDRRTRENPQRTAPAESAGPSALAPVPLEAVEEPPSRHISWASPLTNREAASAFEGFPDLDVLARLLDPSNPTDLRIYANPQEEQAANPEPRRANVVVERPRPDSGVLPAMEQMLEPQGSSVKRGRSGASRGSGRRSGLGDGPVNGLRSPAPPDNSGVGVPPGFSQRSPAANHSLPSSTPSLLDEAVARAYPEPLENEAPVASTMQFEARQNPGVGQVDDSDLDRTTYEWPPVAARMQFEVPRGQAGGSEFDRAPQLQSTLNPRQSGPEVGAGEGMTQAEATEATKTIREQQERRLYTAKMKGRAAGPNGTEYRAALQAAAQGLATLAAARLAAKETVPQEPSGHKANWAKKLMRPADASASLLRRGRGGKKGVTDLSRRFKFWTSANAQDAAVESDRPTGQGGRPDGGLAVSEREDTNQNLTDARQNRQVGDRRSPVSLENSGAEIAPELSGGRPTDNHSLRSGSPSQADAAGSLSRATHVEQAPVASTNTFGSVLGRWEPEGLRNWAAEGIQNNEEGLRRKVDARRADERTLTPLLAQKNARRVAADDEARETPSELNVDGENGVRGERAQPDQGGARAVASGSRWPHAPASSSGAWRTGEGRVDYGEFTEQQEAVYQEILQNLLDVSPLPSRRRPAGGTVDTPPIWRDKGKQVEVVHVAEDHYSPHERTVSLVVPEELRMLLEGELPDARPASVMGPPDMSGALPPPPPEQRASLDVPEEIRVLLHGPLPDARPASVMGPPYMSGALPPPTPEAVAPQGGTGTASAPLAQPGAPFAAPRNVERSTFEWDSSRATSQSGVENAGMLTRGAGFVRRVVGSRFSGQREAEPENQAERSRSPVEKISGTVSKWVSKVASRAGGSKKGRS